MDEKLESLKRCFQTAREQLELADAQVEAIPDAYALHRRRIELEHWIERMKDANMEYDDYEKDLSDFYNAHPDYKERWEHHLNCQAYLDDIVREIVRMGYEWDAARQDFVKMAA